MTDTPAFAAVLAELEEEARDAARLYALAVQRNAALQRGHALRGALDIVARNLDAAAAMRTAEPEAADLCLRVLRAIVSTAIAEDDERLAAPRLGLSERGG